MLTVLQIFEDRELEIGRNILIIGAGLVGCETGWYLASRGKSVKLVDILSEDEILLDEHPTNRSMLLRSMKKEGVEILGQRVLRRIEDEGVIVENLNGPEESLPAENVVIATGFKPRNELKEALVKAAPDIQVFPVGDCKEVRKLYEAIHTPGHSKDSLCFYMEDDHCRALFSGDVVFFEGKIGLLNRSGSNLEDYRENFSKIASLSFDALLPGHNLFVLRGGMQHVETAALALQQLSPPPNFI